MRIKVELEGGPHDGEIITLGTKPPEQVRMIRAADQSLMLTPHIDPFKAEIDGEVSCYHRIGRVPFWGRWRYKYHGPA